MQDPPVPSERFKSRHTLLCQEVRKLPPIALTNLFPKEQAFLLSPHSFLSPSSKPYFCGIQQCSLNMIFRVLLLVG